MKKYMLCRARDVRVGDVILHPDMRVGDISHGALDNLIRFRDENDTATTFRFESELVAIEREVRQ